MSWLITGITGGGLVLLFLIWKTFIVVPMRENIIKERLGKFAATLGPGFHFMLPFFDKAAYRHEMREQAIDVPMQSCITRDNIQVEVDGVVYLKVVDAQKASYGVANYRSASINMAQTTMRSEVGKLTLDETFSERDQVNTNIVREIDKASTPWGVKVMRYEIMNITPSKRVIDTMEKQVEAERQKRAEITMSTGHKESKINLSEGQRIEAVNLSEGEKQRRINESEGRAAEIRLVADATAQGIQMVSEAIRKPGGAAAVRMRLIDQFLEELGKILSTSRVSVVPGQLANTKAFFQGLGEVASRVDERFAAEVTEITPRPVFSDGKPTAPQRIR
ncbi:MAG: paraslipin [Deltaproteobacteria bacterium]|nr:paraslipin [Deltaproteobacteria bacterium]